MSNPGKPPVPNVPELPFLKAYPKVATAVRNAIGYAAVAATGAMVAWLNAKGFDAGWLYAFLPFIIVTVIVSVATFVWSIVVKNKTLSEMARFVLEAAQTGAVPEEVKAIAPPKALAKIEEAGH